MKYYGDITETNGKTIKENNLAKGHRYPIGMAVAVEGSIDIFFVAKCERDNDGSPLYSLYNSVGLIDFGYSENDIHPIDH